MKQKNYSVKYQRQRRFLLILPLLTLPFITMMFWALGGGKGGTFSAKAAGKGGLNLKLPDPRLKDDKGLDKLSFYQQAALQAQKTMDAAKADPYWHKGADDSLLQEGSMLKNYSVDANRAKVYNKLDELKAALNASKTASHASERMAGRNYSLSGNDRSDEAGRLREMMQQMKEDKSADPEMEQLNQMLDKIQAIQNPGKANQTTKQTGYKSIPVKPKKSSADVSLLKSSNPLPPMPDTMVRHTEHNAFYGLSNDGNTDDSAGSNAIECLIPETQTIVTGSTVKMAIRNDVTINDISLPSGTLVFGTASLSNERLRIVINSIRYGNTILPVSLTAYDMDGQEGIFIPGSINRTVAKESTNKAISGMDATMIDPSIGAQAASAGIQAAKTLIGKKVKLIKVTVKSGYKVLLKDINQK